MAKRVLDKSTLVVIEAPGKVSAFRKILGPNAEVVATKGHIRDLPDRKFSVNIKKDFEPTYEYYADKSNICDEITSLSERVDEIYIATDRDREGESIGFAVYDLIPDEHKHKAKRLRTGAIVEKDIWSAVDDLGELDHNLFFAYEARRILDRLVGYKASYPVKQATGGISVGRCQSPTLRLLCEREKEIQEFIPHIYWPISATLEAEDGTQFEASIRSPKEMAIESEEDANEIIDKLKTGDLEVLTHEVKDRTNKPYIPFTTTELQKAAASIYGFDGKRTMSIAQNLYQNHHVITYHRTDSPFIISDMINEIRNEVESIGSEYLPKSVIKYSSKGNAQEAHEACRPTDMSMNEFHGGSDDERKIYRLIWKRTIASQMEKERYKSTSITFAADDKKVKLGCSGKQVEFDGFKRVWDFSSSSDNILPELKVGDKVKIVSIKTERKETKPPARYSYSSLPSKLEELGIGRPATTANLLDILKQRGYITVERKTYIPTDLGMTVCNFMLNDVNFCFMDYQFTANLETRLDQVCDGTVDKLTVLNELWCPLSADIERCKEVKNSKEVTDFDCPKCNDKLLLKHSKYGAFFTCSNYNNKEDKCDYKADVGKDGQPKEKEKKVVVESGIDCPTCGAAMLMREGRYGKFQGCSAFPKCKQMLQEDGTALPPKKTRKKWGKKKK